MRLSGSGDDKGEGDLTISRRDFFDFFDDDDTTAAGGGDVAAMVVTSLVTFVASFWPFLTSLSFNFVFAFLAAALSGTINRKSLSPVLLALLEAEADFLEPNGLFLVEAAVG